VVCGAYAAVGLFVKVEHEPGDHRDGHRAGECGEATANEGLGNIVSREVE
jgi:hypothetical protein